MSSDAREHTLAEPLESIPGRALATRSFIKRIEEAATPYSRTVLIGLTVIYFVLTLWLASVRPVWTDEFYTMYIARIPTLSGCIQALRTGADEHPVFFYRLVRLSLSAFGENGIGLRLPSVIGFWLVCISMYAYVSRRTSRWFGLAAFVFPIISGAVPYSYEGRGYALMMGGGALAALCWDLARDHRYRKLALPGLALGLALASGSHYYGAFLAVPFSLAQLVRTARHRIVDLPVWIAIACTAVPPVLSLPIVLSGRAVAEHFWAVPHWAGLLEFYFKLLMHTILPVYASLVLLGFLSLAGWIRFRAPIPSLWLDQIGVEDLTLIAAFLILPLIILIVAKLITHAFVFRYALSGSIGLWLLVPLLLYAFSSDRRIAAILFVAVAAAYSSASSFMQSLYYLHSRENLRATAALLQARNPRNLPIAFGDYDLFMQLAYYGPPQLRRNIVYLTDFRRSLRYVGNFSVDFSATRINRWFHMNLVDYETFVRNHPDFQVCTDLLYDWRWLLRALTDDGIYPAVITQFETHLILEEDRSGVQSLHCAHANLCRVRREQTDQQHSQARVPLRGQQILVSELEQGYIRS